MSPLYISRVPSVYSLQQLHEDGDIGIPVKGLVPTPLSPVADVPGQLLPKLCYSPVVGTTSKRVRSFGNLATHLVPDVDEPGYAVKTYYLFWALLRAHKAVHSVLRGTIELRNC